MDTEGLEYAGFWIRVGAVLIDAVLLLVVTAPLLVWIYGWGYYGDGKLISGFADFLISWVSPAFATVLLWFGKGVRVNFQSVESNKKGGKVIFWILGSVAGL